MNRDNTVQWGRHAVRPEPLWWFVSLFPTQEEHPKLWVVTHYCHAQLHLSTGSVGRRDVYPHLRQEAQSLRSQRVVVRALEKLGRHAIGLDIAVVHEQLQPFLNSLQHADLVMQMG